MAHEMIHFYVNAFITPTEGHGHNFIRIMNELNSKHNLNITIKDENFEYNTDIEIPKRYFIYSIEPNYISILNISTKNKNISKSNIQSILNKMTNPKLYITSDPHTTKFTNVTNIKLKHYKNNNIVHNLINNIVNSDKTNEITINDFQ